MKKSWKAFWIVCISLAVLGIALCIAGLVLGATVSGIREAFGIHDRWENYFLDDYDDLEYGGSVSKGTEYTEGVEGLDGGREHAASVGHHTENGASVSRFSGIRELDIDVTCLEVQIVKGEESDIIVDTSDITDKMLKDLVIPKKDGELKIELKERKVWENWSKNQYKSQGVLLIQIPEGMQFDEVSLLVGAGILYADDIQAKELDIEVGAGQVSLDSFTADELSLECGAGEASVRGEAVHEANIECGVGSVMYTAVGYQQDYNYELSCGIGELMVGNDSFSGLGKEHSIDNGGSKSMDIECGIGSVTVAFEER